MGIKSYRLRHKIPPSFKQDTAILYTPGSIHSCKMLPRIKQGVTTHWIKDCNTPNKASPPLKIPDVGIFFGFYPI